MKIQAKIECFSGFLSGGRGYTLLIERKKPGRSALGSTGLKTAKIFYLPQHSKICEKLAYCRGASEKGKLSWYLTNW
jgi:hypothetical protein